MENIMNQQDRDLLIRLETKLDGMRGDISEMKGLLSSHDVRIREIEISQSHCTNEVDTLKDEVNRLRSSSNYKDIGTGLLAAIASILAIFVR